MRTDPSADSGAKTEGGRHDAALSSLRDWHQCAKANPVPALTLATAEKRKAPSGVNQGAGCSLRTARVIPLHRNRSPPAFDPPPPGPRRRGPIPGPSPAATPGCAAVMSATDPRRIGPATHAPTARTTTWRWLRVPPAATSGPPTKPPRTDPSASASHGAGLPLADVSAVLPLPALAPAVSPGTAPGFPARGHRPQLPMPARREPPGLHGCGAITPEGRDDPAPTAAAPWRLPRPRRAPTGACTASRVGATSSSPWRPRASWSAA